MPGPFWAIIIDILPEARVNPSAIMPAEPSCAQSQKMMPAFGKRSEIGMKAEPTMPKACAIPCRCSTLTKASSVVIFIGCVLPVLGGWFGRQATSNRTRSDTLLNLAARCLGEKRGAGHSLPLVGRDTGWGWCRMFRLPDYVPGGTPKVLRRRRSGATPTPYPSPQGGADSRASHLLSAEHPAQRLV